MAENKKQMMGENEKQTESSIPGLATRLKDGIVLKDLLEKNSAEFTLDVSESMTDEVGGFELDSYDFDDFGLLSNIDSSEKENYEEIPMKIPFEELGKKMVGVTNDGKIKKLVLRHGSGVVVPSGAVVYIHYCCSLEMQDIPFDSSYQRGKPLRIQLGVGALYPGFEISILSMKVNEKSKFLVEPDYAFGILGCPPRIPRNATLLLEIEIFKIVDGNCISDIDAPLEDKDCFVEISSKAKKYHLLGNDLYSKGDASGAVDNYRKAENILLSCKMNNDEEEALCRKILFKIYTNLCVCYNHPKFKSPERVCLCAREAFYICQKKAEKSAKLFFHLGKAQLSLQDFNKASKYLRKALDLEPNNKDICALMAEVEKKKAKFYEDEKLSYKKAFEYEKPKLTNEKPHIEFANTFMEQVSALINDKTNKIQLPAGLTMKEKEFCKNISQEKGLIYEEIMIGGKRSIFIRKL